MSHSLEKEKKNKEEKYTLVKLLLDF